MKFKEDVKLDSSQVEDRRTGWKPSKLTDSLGPSGFPGQQEEPLRQRVGRRRNDPTMLALLTSSVVPDLYEQVQRKPKRKK